MLCIPHHKRGTVTQRLILIPHTAFTPHLLLSLLLSHSVWAAALPYVPMYTVAAAASSTSGGAAEPEINAVWLPVVWQQAGMAGRWNGSGAAF